MILKKKLKFFHSLSQQQQKIFINFFPLPFNSIFIEGPPIFRILIHTVISYIFSARIFSLYLTRTLTLSSLLFPLFCVEWLMINFYCESIALALNFFSQHKVRMLKVYKRIIIKIIIIIRRKLYFKIESKRAKKRFFVLFFFLLRKNDLISRNKKFVATHFDNFLRLNGDDENEEKDFEGRSWQEE